MVERYRIGGACVRRFWAIALGVLILALIPGFIFESASVMSGYLGALIGGAISGFMTLVGVIRTIDWYREQERSARAEQNKRDEEMYLEKTAKKENSLRLLLGELRNNRTVLRTSLKGDRLGLARLQDVIWLKLQTELDWLDPDTFGRIFDLYSALHEYRNLANEAKGRAAALKLSDDEQQRAERYVLVIETIRATVVHDFPKLNNV